MYHAYGETEVDVRALYYYRLTLLEGGETRRQASIGSKSDAEPSAGTLSHSRYCMHLHILTYPAYA